MKLNRRNVLVGLGGIVASGGALLGTGAFSTVEATRTVTIDTADDSNALLAMEVDSDYADSNAEAGIDLSAGNMTDADGLNVNSTTEFTAMLAITNQGTNTVNIGLAGESFQNDAGDVTVNFTLNDTWSQESFEGSSANLPGVSDDTSIGVRETAVYDLEFVIDSSSVSTFNVDVTVSANAV